MSIDVNQPHWLTQHGREGKEVSSTMGFARIPGSSILAARHMTFTLAYNWVLLTTLSGNVSDPAIWHMLGPLNLRTLVARITALGLMH